MRRTSVLVEAAQRVVGDGLLVDELRQDRLLGVGRLGGGAAGGVVAAVATAFGASLAVAGGRSGGGRWRLRGLGVGVTGKAAEPDETGEEAARGTTVKHVDSVADEGRIFTRPETIFTAAFAKRWACGAAPLPRCIS